MTDHISYDEPSKVFHRPHWIAKMGGVEATGKTKTEAREALMDKVAEAARGPYTPTMIFLRGRAALLWREQNGWYYTVRAVGQNGLIVSNIHYLGGDWNETERVARKHLANYVMDDEIEAVKDQGGILSFSDILFPVMLENIAEVITDQDDRARFIDDWKYQRRVARIMAEQGIPFEEARHIADAIEIKRESEVHGKHA
jgi:hypothetical protein